MTILVAVGEEQISNELVVEGYKFAEAYDEPMTVLHVFPDDDFEAHLDALPDDADTSFTSSENSAARFARKTVEESLDEYDSDRVEAIGRVGDPAESILEVADELDPSYIVIGGRRRSPTGKALFGSITQSVLLKAEQPVVAVLSE